MQNRELKNMKNATSNYSMKPEVSQGSQKSNSEYKHSYSE